MTKILPHYNCLQGEHVFIPHQTWTDTRNTRIESFVCTHCLVVVNKNEWQVHQQELERIAQGLEEGKAIKERGEPVAHLVQHNEMSYIPTDYKEPIKAAAKPTAKPATKSAPKKA